MQYIYLLLCILLDDMLLLIFLRVCYTEHVSRFAYLKTIQVLRTKPEPFCLMKGISLGS